MLYSYWIVSKIQRMKPSSLQKPPRNVNWIENRGIAFYSIDKLLEKRPSCKWMHELCVRKPSSIIDLGKNSKYSSQFSKETCYNKLLTFLVHPWCFSPRPHLTKKFSSIFKTYQKLFIFHILSKELKIISDFRL